MTFQLKFLLAFFLALCPAFSLACVQVPELAIWSSGPGVARSGPGVAQSIRSSPHGLERQGGNQAEQEERMKEEKKDEEKDLHLCF